MKIEIIEDRPANMKITSEKNELNKETKVEQKHELLKVLKV